MRFVVVSSLFVLSYLILILYVFETRIHKLDLLYVFGSRKIAKPFNTRMLAQPFEAHFLSPLTPHNKDLLDQTFHRFIEAAEAANLTYFIYGGTLLGSLRHHNRIPWDDDVDVIMNVSDKPRIAKALSKLGPDYALHITGNDAKHIHIQWKFYPTRGRRVCSYRSPYLDLFFYSENKTHVWNASPGYRATEVWLKRHVFPLHRRPYGNLSVAAPCNGLAVMGRDFNMTICRARSWDHMAEKRMNGTPLSVPCSRLAHLYPFVRSRQMNGSLFVEETLMLYNRSIKSITTRAPC